jgi:hypothetical protein
VYAAAFAGGTTVAGGDCVSVMAPPDVAVSLAASFAVTSASERRRFPISPFRSDTVYSYSR